jgi:hypothetical protein
VQGSQNNNRLQAGRLGSGCESQQGQEFFASPCLNWLWDPSSPLNGSHHSPPTGALVKRTCIYTPWLHRESFTLVMRLFWFSSIPSLAIMLQTLFHILSDSQFCTVCLLMLPVAQTRRLSVFQPRFEHKSSLSQLAWLLTWFSRRLQQLTIH